MKNCKKCRKQLAFDFFYPSKVTKDSFGIYCKPCSSQAAKEYRQKNKEKLKAYESSRKDDPERKLANKKYQQREDVKIRYRKKRLDWKKTNNKKKLAHDAVSFALETGKLKRIPCEVCGEIKVDAHHVDYTKRLEVMWLCRRHHIQWHMKHGSVE